MSIMIAEVYKALVEAGASEDSARAAAGAIPIAKDLATKEGLVDVRAELKQDIAELRAELKQDIADLRAELKQDVAELRAELTHDIASLKADVAELRATLRYNTMFLMLVIGLLVKLVFFP